MRRGYVVLMLVLLLLALAAGCSRPVPEGPPPPSAVQPQPQPQPAPTQPATAPVLTPVAPAPGAPAGGLKPGLTVVSGDAAEWPLYPGRPQTVPLRAYPGVCETRPGGGLEAQIREADWWPHPLNRDFWVPAAVVVVCNAGADAMPMPALRLTVLDGTAQRSAGYVTLPPMEPGMAIGPLRLYATAGFPAAIGALWKSDPTRWPNWTIQVSPSKGEALAHKGVRRTSGGSPQAYAGDYAPWPEFPSLDLLKRLAWSQGTVPLDGGGSMTFFLYAPEVRYELQTDSYCGAMAGQLTTGAQRWGIYGSVNGGPPVRMAEVGLNSFEGGRGMTVLRNPAITSALLLLGHYGSCANPTWHEVWQYDQAAGAVFRPMMRRQDGTVAPATVTSPTVTDDGRLTSRSYNNAGATDFGWNTSIYRWAPGQPGGWQFEQHLRN